MSVTRARLLIVDVFTQAAFRGNPVAVILTPVTPAPEQMLRIAGWTGMPETVFVVPVQAQGARDDAPDYAVRIWSSTRELAFAGHPSIGTAHALLEAGLVTPRAGLLKQHCAAGCIDLRVTAAGPQRRIAFRTPAAAITPLDEAGHREVRAALGSAAASAPSACVAAGARWIVAELAHAAQVHALRPDLDAVLALSARYDVSGITAFGPCDAGDADYEVRSFAPALGVPEDAACGGGNACAAAWVAARHRGREGSADSVISQGRQVGRDARIFWSGPDAHGRLEIGGHAVTVSDGSFLLP